MFCDCAIPRTAGSAPIWETPRLTGEAERFARRGAEVFAATAPAAMDREGRGDGPAAVALDARTARPDIRPVLRPPPERIALERCARLIHAPVERFRNRRLAQAWWPILKSLAPAEPAPALTDTERSSSRTIFARECAVCHGPDGRGDGPASAILAPAPTNFHETRPTTAHAEVGAG